jgi:hypothetical protein
MPAAGGAGAGYAEEEVRRRLLPRRIRRRCTGSFGRGAAAAAVVETRRGRACTGPALGQMHGFLHGCKGVAVAVVVCARGLEPTGRRWMRRPRCRGLRLAWCRGRVRQGWRFAGRWGSRRPRWKVLGARCRTCSEGAQRSPAGAGKRSTGSPVAVTRTSAVASAACRRRAAAVPAAAGRTGAAGVAAVVLALVVGSAGTGPRHLLRRMEQGRLPRAAAGRHWGVGRTVDIGRVLSIFTISYAELRLIRQLSRRRTLSRRRGVEPLGILRLGGSAIALARRRIALGDRWTHCVLVIGRPWRVRHR